jgi:hypothetical protein
VLTIIICIGLSKLLHCHSLQPVYVRGRFLLPALNNFWAVLIHSAILILLCQRTIVMTLVYTTNMLHISVLIGQDIIGCTRTDPHTQPPYIRTKLDVYKKIMHVSIYITCEKISIARDPSMYGIHTDITCSDSDTQ